MELFIIYILMLIVPLIASIGVKTTYNKYKKQGNERKLTGFDVAKEILTRNGLDDIYIVEITGELTDCYDPKRKTVKLSSDIFHGESISALAVAAHECGHAIQDKEKYSWMSFRKTIFPVVSIATSISYIVLIIGLILGALDLVYLAIALTSLGLVFQLVTLPVEFDASKRANNLLLEYGLVSEAELKGTKKVLTSAAWTYVAGVISAALEVLYLVLRYTDRR